MLTVLQVIYNQTSLGYNSSVCYNRTDPSCTCYEPQETSAVLRVTEDLFAWH
jgi:hypothetical protein